VVRAQYRPSPEIPILVRVFSLCGDDYAIEVQLRTIRQDAWANQLEEDGRGIGVGLKFGEGGAGLHDYYRAVSEAFALMDRGEPLPDGLVATLNTRYAIIKGILPRDE
jgi:hypothetical protein